MQITLRANGAARVYENECVTMRDSIRAYKLLGKIEAAAGEFDDKLIDEGLDFIRGLYGNQFTRDELLDGSGESFFTLIPGTLRQVIAGVSDAVAEIPNTTATQTTGAN